MTHSLRYAEYRPVPALAAVVERFWFLEGAGSGVPEPIIPDGRIEIVIHFGDPFERHYLDGRVERQSHVFIVGQMRAPICIASGGRAGVAGIRLRPAAVRAVMGCRATELSGLFVDADALLGPTSVLRERLAGARDDQRVALLEWWVLSFVRHAVSPDVDAAVDAITMSGGAAGLVTIAGHAGVSLRQLERRFLADVGLTPKVFARVVRLQRALRCISDGAALADAAAACGYYDQAHMGRDFGRLAETSPAAWQRYSGVLTPLFVSR